MIRTQKLANRTDLKHYRSQEWNEFIATVTNGGAVCACNGVLPETGPIAKEGDRGQMEY